MGSDLINHWLLGVPIEYLVSQLIGQLEGVTDWLCGCVQVRQQAACQMDADTMRKFSHMLLAMADVQSVIIVLCERLQVGECLTPVLQSWACSNQ